MAMDGNQLGQEIASAVMDAKATPEAKAAVIAHYQKIANAIVLHIQSNAEVPAGIPVTTSGGPTSQAGGTVSPGSVL